MNTVWADFRLAVGAVWDWLGCFVQIAEGRVFVLVLLVLVYRRCESFSEWLVVTGLILLVVGWVG